MGASGIIFTVDLAVLGNRELDKRAKLADSGVSTSALGASQSVVADVGDVSSTASERCRRPTSSASTIGRPTRT